MSKSSLAITIPNDPKVLASVKAALLASKLTATTSTATCPQSKKGCLVLTIAKQTIAKQTPATTTTKPAGKAPAKAPTKK